ncbi:hypothetical protein B0H10DRAFT_1016633 [Mycena sp. CBHHK59/15]|nr:hypothetical protein B0H10DRAFT_1016633 [Mycena sp. CBHHK59/15]
MALTDEGISDEMLVEKLEAMRVQSHIGASLAHGSGYDGFELGDWDGDWRTADSGHGHDFDDLCSAHGHEAPCSDDGLHGALTVKLPSPVSMPALPSSLQSPATWQSARRALLTCRELVRTERHYLSALRGLLAGATLTAPPPLMLRYAGELTRESAGLLRRMEDDPSAWGIAAAFLGAEEGIDHAFVAWCGVVGGWFVGGRSVSTIPRRLSKMRGVSEGDEELAGVPRTPTKRTAAAWRKSVASASASLAAPPSPTSATTFLARRKEREERGKGCPPVRDLAILPTQRVMRYVLLYRDLLEHTPSTSPSHALVEQAVDAAVRIAQKCDRAQGNAAFLQHR